jgi:hypothetical protein
MPFRLLVEGSDDQHLIRNLLRDHGVTLDLPKEILDCGGVETLLHDSLRLHLSFGYTSIGIVVDADYDIQTRWDSVRNRLVQEGYEIPLTPQPEGLIITTRQPTVGVWIMPDNKLPGTIEDFAKQLVPDGDDLWPLVEQSVAAIPSEWRRFADASTRKAQIHTYLAWQKDPGTPLGLAITKKYFQTNAELALTFVDWIKRLRTP